MKRHNSFHDDYHIKKKPHLLNPSDILNGYGNNKNIDDDQELDDDSDEFINTLTLKVGLLKKDPLERLMEFEYKTELRKLTTIEYYKHHKFTL